MSRKSSSNGGGNFSLNRILHALCFAVLILLALILSLNLISISGKTLLDILHLGILRNVKDLLLIIAVMLGAYPFAMKCKKGWRITYWIIVIIVLAVFVFGWIRTDGIVLGK